eukprot:13574704-Alexandrium_andersonii.AAC.1
MRELIERLSGSDTSSEEHKQTRVEALVLSSQWRRSLRPGGTLPLESFLVKSFEAELGDIRRNGADARAQDQIQRVTACSADLAVLS